MVRDIPSSESDNQVHHHKQDALKPVRFAVSNEVVDQKDRHKQQDNLEAVKVESLQETKVSIREHVTKMLKINLPYHQHQ